MLAPAYSRNSHKAYARLGETSRVMVRKCQKMLNRPRPLATFGRCCIVEHAAGRTALIVAREKLASLGVYSLNMALGGVGVRRILGSIRKVRTPPLVSVDAQSPNPLCRGRPACSPVIGTQLHIDHRLTVGTLDDAQFHVHAVREAGFVSDHLGPRQA